MPWRSHREICPSDRGALRSSNGAALLRAGSVSNATLLMGPRMRWAFSPLTSAVSMNPSAGLRPGALQPITPAPGRRPALRLGSWPQLTSSFWRCFLSMNPATRTPRRFKAFRDQNQPIRERFESIGRFMGSFDLQSPDAHWGHEPPSARERLGLRQSSGAFDSPGRFKPKRQRTGAVQNLAALRRFIERSENPRSVPARANARPVEVSRNPENVSSAIPLTDTVVRSLSLVRIGLQPGVPAKGKARPLLRLPGQVAPPSNRRRPTVQTPNTGLKSPANENPQPATMNH